MITFEDEVAEVACEVRVSDYRPAVPPKLTGPPEDCHPGEPADLEFALYRHGAWAPRLEAEVTDEDLARFLRRTEEILRGEEQLARARV